MSYRGWVGVLITIFAFALIASLVVFLMLVVWWFR